MSVKHVTVGDEDEGIRLDRWFRGKFPQVTQGRLEKMLRRGEIRVDGGRVRANLRVTAGMVVRVPPLPDAEARETPTPRPVSATDAADLQARVLHRDDLLIVIDKPAGLAVQGGSGTTRHLDGLLDALRFDAPERPRLVHRLDRDTSGVLVLARTRAAAAAVAAAFRDRAARKLYWALVRGVPDPEAGRIESTLEKVAAGGGREQIASGEDGKSALTTYRTIAHGAGGLTWLALTPMTGRTHQLRVHCAEAGFPILGDRRYGDRPAIPQEPNALGRGLHLHARSLEIPHPRSGVLRVIAPLPSHMEQSWRFLRFDAETVQNDATSDA
ncbi:MAG: RluA family pseudouridine synthase [Alphaproteobacteria bacterium]